MRIDLVRAVGLILALLVVVGAIAPRPGSAADPSRLSYSDLYWAVLDPA